MIPQQALTRLEEDLNSLRLAGNLLIERRKAHMLAEAKLIDSETEARKEYFDSKPCKVSELRDWLKMKTAFEYAAERLLHNEIRTIQIQYDILQESINVLKMSVRIMDTEIKNLNYEPSNN